MAESGILAVPEIGQTARVRNRQWAVSDVRRNALGDESSHLIDLVSVEDDAEGETLQVIWELEPAAAVLAHGTLPEVDGFDPPERLQAFLDAVRWGSIASADSRQLQAPFRSGITIEDYQLVPLNRALQMARVNLLIADDVGLGKTIEAGLVAVELILRHRARTVLIVCPPSLQVQWRDQMKDKFGLDFRIVDRELFRTVRREFGIHVNPWTHFPRLIVSIDFLKRSEPMRLMRDTLPSGEENRFPRRFDLLIVDEAHNIAPSGTGKYATDSGRTKAIRELAPHFEHRLFLTATPHNGFPESFSALLELLDDQRFARAVPPDAQQRDQVMIRRLKTDLLYASNGTRRFAEREVSELQVQFTADEEAAYRNLQEYFDLRRRRDDQTRAQQVCLEFVLKTLKKRFFSSPAAFARTIEQHLRTVEHAMNRSAHSPSQTLLDHELEQLFAEFDDRMEFAEGETDEVPGKDSNVSQMDASDALAGGLELAASALPIITSDALSLLKNLRTWAQNAEEQPDSKAKQLLRWLNEHVRDCDERVIIFTEYRDTQKWLAGLLASHGFLADGQTELVHGGLDWAERERIKAAFQADPEQAPVRILLATDAASEGLDLQNYCHQVIHFEIPWNPNRLEQRNGRVDRHGQHAPKVFIHHFVGSGYASRGQGDQVSLGNDLEFLARVARKVNQIREDLGSTGPVLSSRVEDVLLGQIRGSRSLDDIGSDDRTKQARVATPSDRSVNSEIERAMETMVQTREDLNLSPERVQAAVSEALILAGELPLQKISLPEADGRTVPAWKVPHFTKSSWRSAREGLDHPYSGVERPIVFDHNVAKRLGDRVVLAHLRHPLVERSLRFLRAAVWGNQAHVDLHRVTIRVVPDDAIDSIAVTAYGRMVVTGGDGQRLHEQIISAGGRLREGRFARMNVGDVDSALNAPALGIPVPESKRSKFIEQWAGIRDSLNSALENRQQQRTNNLQTAVAARRDTEVGAMNLVLSELEASIRRQLIQLDGNRQLSLFETYSDREKDQFRRDREFLQRRLTTIPDELAREVMTIQDRYANTQPRLFPVAIVWLVPQRELLA